CEGATPALRGTFQYRAGDTTPLAPWMIASTPAPPSPSPPTISSFSPTSGPPGSTVTLTGTNFTGATTVTFGSTPASFGVDSASQISATVPANAATGRIAVTTPGGTAISGSDFAVTAPPTPQPAISSFSPTSGQAGTRVTIAGANLGGASL